MFIKTSYTGCKQVNTFINNSGYVDDFLTSSVNGLAWYDPFIIKFSHQPDTNQTRHGQLSPLLLSPIYFLLNGPSWLRSRNSFSRIYSKLLWGSCTSCNWVSFRCFSSTFISLSKLFVWFILVFNSLFEQLGFPN